MALVIAMSMIMAAMSLSAFAADNEAKTLDATVQITGLEAGDIVNFYKVVAWDQNSGWVLDDTFSTLGNEGVGLSSGVVVGYNASKGDVTAIQSDVLKYISGIPGTATTTYNNGEPVITYTDSIKGRINSELAAKIAEIVTGTDGDYSETVATGGTSVTWGDPETEGKPEAGLYVALVTPKKAGVMYNPIFVSADYDSTNAEGYSNVQTAVADPSLSYSDEAMAKKTTIDVKKTINSDPDTGDASQASTTEGDSATSVDAGEIIQFKVETTIPEYSNLYTTADFTVSDTLTGLKLVIDETHKFEIKAGSTSLALISDSVGQDLDSSKANFTNTAANDADNYKIDFTPEYILGLSAATKLEITYWAKITDTATKVVNPTDNTVTVEFSNNPNDTSDKGTLKDRTNQYSFSIDADINGKEGKTSSELIKIGVDKDGYPLTQKKSYDNGLTEIPALKGATFALLTDTTNAAKLIGKNKDELLAYSGEGSADIYKNTINGTEVKAVLDSDGNGKLNFKGLDKGTYYLVETKAPDGFIRDTTIYEIEITPTYEEKEVKETVEDIEVTYKAQTLVKYTVKITPSGGTPVTSEYEPVLGANQAAGSMTFTNITNHIAGDDNNDPDADHSTLLVNKQGVELPSTGGIGTTIFYTIGAILVIGAGVILITRRRMDA